MIKTPEEKKKKLVETVKTEWLEENLMNKEIQILDVQPNIHDYIQAHIPGAVYFNPDLLRVPFEGLPGQYVPVNVAKTLFERIGLEKDRPAIVYTGKGLFKGWGDGLEQTMIAYSLARFGHNNVKVLDGGLEKWISEGRRVSKEFPEVIGSTFKTSVRQEFFLGYNEFRKIKDREGVIVLDARPPDIYQGQGPWKKPGHIPGAVNLPWKSLMDDENPRLLKPMDEIGVILAENGVGRDKEIICTCGTGREATNEFLLLRFYLDYPRVRIYEGSFTEWSSHPENETVTGPDPR